MTTAMSPVRPLAALAVTLALAACASLTPLPHVGRTPEERANIAAATALYDALVNDKDFDAARPYLGDAFIEHAPGVADGLEGLEAFVDTRRANAPDARTTIEAAYADGDFVILHVHSDQPAGTPGTAIVNIVRFEDAKAVEHWSVTQQIPPDDEAMNDNTMFYTTTPPEPLPLTREQELANRDVAVDFCERALNEKHWPSARDLIGDVYIQHNLRAVDGPEGIGAHVANLRENFPENRGDIQAAYVDGDRVILHNRVTRAPNLTPIATVDILRVEDGKVVEHWDVVQTVPDNAKNDNGMFYTTQ